MSQHERHDSGGGSNRGRGRGSDSEGGFNRGRGRGRGRARLPPSDEPHPRTGAGDGFKGSPLEQRVRSLSITEGRASSPSLLFGEPQHQPRPSRPAAVIPRSSPATSQSPSYPSVPTEMATRPGQGENGKPIRLLVNHFPVRLMSDVMFHYDLEVEQDRTYQDSLPNAKTGFPPKPVPSFMKREIMEELFKRETVLNKVCPTFDGNKNIFTCSPIEGIGGFMKLVYQKPNPGRDYTTAYNITIKPVSKEGQREPVVQLSKLRELYRGQTTEISYEALQGLDIALRHGSNQQMATNGRSFFRLPGPNSHKLRDGKLVGTGFYQSLRPDSGGSALVVNRSNTLFYPTCTVMDYIGEVLRTDPYKLKMLKPDQISQLGKELRDARFVGIHLENSSTFKCDGLTRENSRALTFPKEIDGKTVIVTVAEHFQKTYNIPLRYPMFPCLKNGKRCFPIEVCTLPPGQLYKHAISDQHRSDMIKVTITSPEKCLQDIRESVNLIIKNCQPVLEAYKIQIIPDPLAVNARVLVPPRVLYKEGKEILNPRDGAWNLRDTPFFQAGLVSNWAVLCSDQKAYESGDIKMFCERLCNSAKRMGIWMKPALAVQGRPLNNVANELTSIQRLVKEKAPGSRLDLLLIVLSMKNDDLYSEIKFQAETKLGLMTQCVLSKNVCNGGQSLLIGNLLQKINSKLGGRNCSVFPPSMPSTMFMGADVNHASKRDRERRSFAAVVASVDSQANRFVSSVREQSNTAQAKNHLEMIGDMRKTSKAFLEEFYKNTGKYPERIIYYRDGVSEGEFAEVKKKEVLEIRRAFRELGANCKMTVVVVAKRHHTRLFPQDPKQGVGKFRNVPPGTVLDRTVVHPLFYDFYLCSHFGIQGTSRPTHYTVLEDDWGFSADDLQSLTYHLCHLSARCTRAESIPTPVKYAHLSALRHRHYSHHGGARDDEDEDEEDGDSGEDVDQFLETVTPLEAMSKSMWFV